MDEEPREKKKKVKNTPNKKVPIDAATEPVATGIMETESRYIAGHQFPQVQRPADATTYVNDGNLADLIERSITKLIPEIAGEAVRQINNQLPTSVPTTATPPVYDQDIDMDVVRLRNVALSSRQTGRVPEHGQQTLYQRYSRSS